MQATKKMTAIMAMAMVAATANGAEPATPATGLIDFTGEIVGQTCTVKVPLKAVPLGKWNKDVVTAAKDTGTTPQEFKVSLTGCQKKDVASVTVSADKAPYAAANAQSTFDIKNTGSAMNVAIGVKHDNAFIDFAKGKKIYTWVDEGKDFEAFVFYANIRETQNGKADAGKVAGQMTVTVEYK